MERQRHPRTPFPHSAALHAGYKSRLLAALHVGRHCLAGQRLELLRPANVVTALADVLAGFAIADLGNPLALPWLLLSTASLYGGGVVLNDFFDRALDAVERPERPIPSGRVRPQAAAACGAILGSMIGALVGATVVLMAAAYLGSLIGAALGASLGRLAAPSGAALRWTLWGALFCAIVGAWLEAMVRAYDQAITGGLPGLGLGAAAGVLCLLLATFIPILLPRRRGE